MRIPNLIIVCLILIFAEDTLGKEWRGIIPLHSTRADVERVLGPPREPGGSSYPTENGNVSIDYSLRSCEEGERWNVPRDVVLSITIYPRTNPTFASLQLDESKFRRVVDTHIEGSIYYINDEQGIHITTLEGVVHSITYEPAASDNHLLCPGVSPPSIEDEEGTAHPRPLDEYGDLPFEDEKVRLDNLAIELQLNPELKGYIIVYAGRRSTAGVVQERAGRAKNYLVNERGVAAQRIVTIDGGYREDLTVTLYVWPRNLSAPIATPTLSPSEVQIIPVGSCPMIRIVCLLGCSSLNPKHRFAANLHGYDPALRPTFNWRVSGGVITNGQGTDSIEVDACNIEREILIITVEVGGVIPEGCGTTATYSIDSPSAERITRESMRQSHFNAPR
jgi:hypothetical protein